MSKRSKQVGALAVWQRANITAFYHNELQAAKIKTPAKIEF